jgi:hypothetical protein
MNIYKCTDGSVAAEEIEASSPEEAAREWVEWNDFASGESTQWIEVKVEDDDGYVEEVTVQLDPDEPECSCKDGHDWQSPHSVLGGLEENPGVRGHGGGVIMTEVCAHCGRYRETDTWAQRPDTGEQGLRSVTYADADERSKAWIDGGEEQF